MKNSSMNIFLQIIVSFLFFNITGCDSMNKDDVNKLNTPIVEISIGDAGEKFSQKYPNLVSAEHQPAGLSFYKAFWNTQNKGRVKIVHQNHSFEISDVLNVVGTEDDSDKKSGMFVVSIHSGISGQNGISHKDALEKFSNLLSDMRRAGWQSTVPLGLPRLRGRDMLQYLFESKDSTTLDSNYKLSLQEWMSLDDLTGWELYADGVFMRATFLRDQSKMDVDKPSSYVIKITLRSAEAYFSDFADLDDRKNWRAVVPGKLDELAQRRKRSEEEWSGKGMHIDKLYVDPPFPIIR